MINTSCSIIFVNGSKSLEKTLRHELTEYCEDLPTRNGLKPPSTQFLDFALKKNLFKPSILQDVSRDFLDKNKDPVKFFGAKGSDGITLSDMAKGFILHCWNKRLLIPNHNFDFEGGLKVHGHIHNFIGPGLLDIAKRKQRAIKADIIRFFQITDWKAPSDIDLDEVWVALREAAISFHTLKMAPVALVSEYANDSGCHYSVEDAAILRRFGCAAARLTDGHALKNADFKAVKEYSKNSFIYGGQQHFGKKCDFATKNRLCKIKRSTRDGRQQCRDILIELANKNNIIEYSASFSKYLKDSNNNWMKNGFYPGRDHVNVEQMAADWIDLGKTYLSTLKGSHGSIKSAKAHLRILFDYIFCYLPWWFELNPDTKNVEFPSTPKQFKRVLFWKSEAAKAAGMNLPMSAIEFFKLRRTEPQLYSYMLSVSRFFDWVREEAVHLMDVGLLREIDVSFLNPVNTEADSEGAPYRGPTDKIAFPIRVMPTVVEIYRALEDTLYSLQQYFINSTPYASEDCWRFTHSHTIDLTEFNLSMTINVPGFDQIVVSEIPNVVSWQSVEVFVGGTPHKKVVPFLSAFRMLRTTLHAGQRMQNIQWLDIDEFDKLLTPTDEASYFNPLYLTIDKVDPGRTPLVPRFIMEMLLREKGFQLHQLADQPIKIHYEHNEQSGYNKLRPLFRSFASPKRGPFSDSVYQDTWLNLLIFIEEMYNTHFSGGEYHQFTYEEKAPENSKKPTLIKAVHTPHSMRNTYILYRKDLVDIQLIMAQTGQTERVALHYAQAQPRGQLEALLEKADRVISTPIDLYADSGLFGESLVTPSRPNSAIRTRIAEDRQAAINEQRMLTINVPDMDGIDGDSGIKKLKIQQDTQIAYFNECVCPTGGNCPVEVMGIIEESRRCGLCPMACFGIDHLPGVLAKTRTLTDAVASGQKQLAIASKKGLASDIEIKLKRTIRLNALEASALITVASMLRHARNQAMNDTYLARKPDLVEKAVEISLDTSLEASRFLSKLADANQFPEFASEAFMSQIERLARRLCNENPNLNIEGHDDITLVASHIASIMRNRGLTLSDLAQSKELLLLTNGSGS